MFFLPYIHLLAQGHSRFFTLFRFSKEGHVIGAVDAFYLRGLKREISPDSPAQYSACEGVAARYQFFVRKSECCKASSDTSATVVSTPLPS